MSDKKIIIRNCPCFNEGHPVLDYYGECLSLTDDAQVCQDCTDCVMKQIVKKCRKSLEVSYCPIEKEILELLDIEEIE